MQVPIKNAIWRYAGPETFNVTKSTFAVRTQESANEWEEDTRTITVPWLAVLRTVQHTCRALGAAFSIQPNSA